MRPPLSSSKRAFVAAISGAAPEKQDGGIVRRRISRAEARPHICGCGAGLQASFADAGLEPLVARLEMDAMTVLFLFEKREQHTQHRRQIFLDTGRNKFSNACLR